MKRKDGRDELIRFCVRRERSKREVEDKIVKLGLPIEWLQELEQEGWWSQERYARAYAFDHWNLYHWGKQKIAYALRSHGVPSNLIEKALSTIPNTAYFEKLKRRMKKMAGPNESSADHLKIREHFLKKGYSLDEIVRVELDWDD